MKELASMILFALCLSSAFATERSMTSEASEGRGRHRGHPLFHHHKDHKEASAPAPVETAAADPAEDPATVAVPAAPAAGKDGFPALPAVTQMLGGASKTMESINSQAAVLQARMVQNQHENEVRMSQQKVVYEKKLKEQEKESRVVIADNDKLSGEIDTLKSENSKLKKHAEDLQDGNKLRRTELKTLESKLGAAKDFATAALKSTDDSKAKELAVLDLHSTLKIQKVQKLAFGKKADEEKTDDDDSDDSTDDEKGSDDDSDDSDDDDESDRAGTSLVAVSTQHIGKGKGHRADSADQTDHHPHADASNLVQILSKGVDEMTEEAKASEKKLQTMFVTAFQAGGKRHTVLVAQRKSLQTTRAELEQLQVVLNVAIAHLKSTREKLDQRLKGMGSFMQRLSKLALAPAGEVPRLMEGLPAAVSLAQTSSRRH